LDTWIARKIGVQADTRLTVERIRSRQLELLRKTIDYACERSLFYRDHLAGLRGANLMSLHDLTSFPFTTPDDLREKHRQFLCVSQSQVERVVTLFASGPENEPRRVYFTAQDLELTTDFFHHGMTALVEPGQRVLILMPGGRPWSVGDLLVKALDRMNVRGIVHGVVQEAETAIEDICRREPDCLVGIPTQVLAIARHPRAAEIPTGLIKSILLSADYVPSPITRELRDVWGCNVFNHYGTTEMGLGGGVECEALAGYHLREADLYFEIIDPDSGQPRPSGLPGEVVFTTLTRTGMPLVRYRTGDLSRFLSDPCPCGTELPRMDKIGGRLKDMIRLPTGDWLGIPDLDEILFEFPEVLNYTATLIEQSNGHRLRLELLPKPDCELPDQASLDSALRSLPVLESALAQGCLSLEPASLVTRNRISTGVEKRSIVRSSDKGHGNNKRHQKNGLHASGN
jgi:phenylacetate-CoA ligase